jgi:hypothetical protein
MYRAIELSHGSGHGVQYNGVNVSENCNYFFFKFKKVFFSSAHIDYTKKVGFRHRKKFSPKPSSVLAVNNHAF